MILSITAYKSLQLVQNSGIKFLKKWKIQDKDKKTSEIITYRDRPVKRIKKAFNAAKKRAGINRRLRIYDFCHSFATTVLGEEGDLKSASEIMGHL
jgi:site-specific recombinase XerD